jgi:hypothetical protein
VNRVTDDLLEKFRTWPTTGATAKQLGVSRMRIKELLTKGRLQSIAGPFGYRLISPISIAAFQHERNQWKARVNRRRSDSSSHALRKPAKVR